ncbi:MAG: PLP-dependent aspartate aminotransferase family protein [Lachnospiraceae bacterium]
MNKKTGLILEHLGEEYERYYNAVVPPIFMNSLHIFETIDDYYDSDKTDKHTYCYGRVQNPTVRILEEKIAALEEGCVSYVFSSGMSAAAAAVLASCKTGGHVICVRNAYGPLQNFLTGYCREHMKIETTFVDGDTVPEFFEAFRDNTQLIVLESPSSVIFSVQDIRGVSELAKSRGARVYIDNTFCTPIYQKPLAMGADYVMHTTSKYMGGHSDLIGGVLTVKDEALGEEIRMLREQLGSIIGPMEGWLILRGMRTLEVRVKEHERTAGEIAQYLENHPKVKKVYYTGLTSHPQRELIEKQQSGSTGLLSFEIDGSLEQAKKFCQSLEVFKIGVSWGGFESLVMMPYARQSEEISRTMRGTSSIIRIHCGLEGAELLIQDLEQGLQKI